MRRRAGLSLWMGERGGFSRVGLCLSLVLLDPAEVYASVDLFVFPSEVETFGNVTLEALASGVPCIASAGCSGHLVYHGVNGFVVNQADVDEYYELTKR